MLFERNAKRKCERESDADGYIGMHSGTARQSAVRSAALMQPHNERCRETLQTAASSCRSLVRYTALQIIFLFQKYI